MKKVLVAGATGYLGRYVVQELKEQGYWVRVLARNTKKLDDLKSSIDEMFEAEVTAPETLNGICDGIDVVISSIGITRQKDGLTYMDVDYQGNSNLLKEALRSGVGKFVYVSLLNGQVLKELKIVEAKERFVAEIKKSDIAGIIIRPNGFFSDMTELLTMAKKGTVYLFGNGEFKGNPIHGADLAAYMVQKLDSDQSELDIGGPDVLSQNQMARAAFKAAGRKEKMVYIPLWIKNILLRLVRWFTSPKTYGPIEFFMTVMSMDMVAPAVGKYHLEDFFMENKDSL
jgi:uncharacterized protein YbjT (DUF2867 family)